MERLHVGRDRVVVLVLLIVNRGPERGRGGGEQIIRAAISTVPDRWLPPSPVLRFWPGKERRENRAGRCRCCMCRGQRPRAEKANRPVSSGASFAPPIVRPFLTARTESPPSADENGTCALRRAAVGRART